MEEWRAKLDSVIDRALYDSEEQEDMVVEWLLYTSGNSKSHEETKR